MTPYFERFSIDKTRLFTSYFSIINKGGSTMYSTLTAYPERIQKLPIGVNEDCGAYRLCKQAYWIVNSIQVNKFLKIHFQRHPIGKGYPVDVINVWRKDLQGAKEYWPIYPTLPAIDKCLTLYAKNENIEPTESKSLYSGAKIYKHIFPSDLWQLIGVYRFFHTKLNEDDVFQAPIHYVHLEKIAIRKLMKHHFNKYSNLSKIRTLAYWITLIDPLREEEWKSYIALWLAIQGALKRIINHRPILDEKMKKTTETIIYLHKDEGGYEIYIISPK